MSGGKSGGGRWTYIPGEGVGGGIWFTNKEVQLFYSHHASDPWQGKGQNVWQFVSHYLFNGDTRGGKVQRFFRKNYDIEYVAEDWEKKDLKDERLKKQDNIAFLKTIAREGSIYRYFIHTILIPEEKEYNKDSLYMTIWNTLDRIRNIFISQRDREYNRDCWQLVQLVSNMATSNRGGELAGATETIIDRIITSRWRPVWMRRRYDALNKDTDPRGLKEAQSRCREIWSWWDNSINVEIMEYWIRQVKYGVKDVARRIAVLLWTHDTEVGKSTTGKMLSAILEGETFEEWENNKNAALVRDGELDNELKLGSFDRPKAIERRSVILNDIHAPHFRRHYRRFVGWMEGDTIEIETKHKPDKNRVPIYPNYIFTTNDMASDFIDKEGDRRIYSICWDNGIRKRVSNEELWNIIRGWVMSLSISGDDWEEEAYKALKPYAVEYLINIDLEEKIRSEASERFFLEAAKELRHRFDVGKWIAKFWLKEGDTRLEQNRKRSEVVDALLKLAPGCMRPHKSRGRDYYQWGDAIQVLKAIRRPLFDDVNMQNKSELSENQEDYFF